MQQEKEMLGDGVKLGAQLICSSMQMQLPHSSCFHIVGVRSFIYLLSGVLSVNVPGACMVYGDI